MPEEIIKCEQCCKHLNNRIGDQKSLHPRNIRTGLLKNKNQGVSPNI